MIERRAFDYSNLEHWMVDADQTIRNAIRTLLQSVVELIRATGGGLHRVSAGGFDFCFPRLYLCLMLSLIPVQPLRHPCLDRPRLYKLLRPRVAPLQYLWDRHPIRSIRLIRCFGLRQRIERIRHFRFQLCLDFSRVLIGQCVAADVWRGY